MEYVVLFEKAEPFDSLKPISLQLDIINITFFSNKLQTEFVFHPVPPTVTPRSKIIPSLILLTPSTRSSGNPTVTVENCVISFRNRPHLPKALHVSSSPVTHMFQLTTAFTFALKYSTSYPPSCLDNILQFSVARKGP